jgi:uncharacterized protein YjbI with pentapeptide repeats
MRTPTQAQLDDMIAQHELTWEPPGVQEGVILPLLGKRMILDFYDLTGLDFSGHDLRSCHLVDCILVDCNFLNAKISHAEFMRSDLTGANMNVDGFSGTDFTGCIGPIPGV